MAILNAQETFSDLQAVTSTAVSTNNVDLNPNAGPNATQGIADTLHDVYLVVNTVDAATDTGSDATLTITLESSPNADLSSSVVHYTTGALAFAAFSPAGTNLVNLPLPIANYNRYLFVRYTVASGPLTAGSFDAYLTRSLDRRPYYARGYTQ